MCEGFTREVCFFLEELFQISILSIFFIFSNFFIELLLGGVVAHPRITGET